MVEADAILPLYTRWSDEDYKSLRVLVGGVKHDILQAKIYLRLPLAGELDGSDRFGFQEPLDGGHAASVVLIVTIDEPTMFRLTNLTSLDEVGLSVEVPDIPFGSELRDDRPTWHLTDHPCPPSLITDMRIWITRHQPPTVEPIEVTNEVPALVQSLGASIARLEKYAVYALALLGLLALSILFRH